jgi:hypothetical protein
MNHGTNILPKEGSSTFLSRSYKNSDITPFAMCATKIEAAMVHFTVGSEILCNQAYFILNKEKQYHSGSANFKSAFRFDVSN